VLASFNFKPELKLNNAFMFAKSSERRRHNCESRATDCAEQHMEQYGTFSRKIRFRR